MLYDSKNETLRVYLAGLSSELQTSLQPAKSGAQSPADSLRLAKLGFDHQDRGFKSEEYSTLPKGLYQPVRVSSRAIGKDESAVEEIESL